jgi:hypothetical protein
MDIWQLIQVKALTELAYIFVNSKSQHPFHFTKNQANFSNRVPSGKTQP